MWLPLGAGLSGRGLRGRVCSFKYYLTDIMHIILYIGALEREPCYGALLEVEIGGMRSIVGRVEFDCGKS